MQPSEPHFTVSPGGSDAKLGMKSTELAQLISHLRKPQPVDTTKLVRVTHLDPELEFMTSSLLLSLPFQTASFPVFDRSSLSLPGQRGGEGRGGERHWLILSWERGTYKR